MASGKQLSFMYGEVSPTQFYKSNDVVYGNALSKMRNFFVQASGGSANRPGFISEGVHDYQGAIPTVGGVPGIKGSSFLNPFTNEIQLIEYYKDSSHYKFFVDGTAKFLGSGFSLDVLPEKIDFISLKSKIFITPTLTVDDTVDYKTNPAYDMDTEAMGVYGSYFAPSTSSLYGSYSGKAPFLPVSYYVTAIYKDGTERIITSFGSKGYDPASASTWDTAVAKPTVLHPHADMQSQLALTFSSAPPDIKQFVFYRAIGAGYSTAGTGVGPAGNGFYKRAGVIPYDGSSLTVDFIDFGADDASQGPPLDSKLYGGGGSTGMGGANACAYFQQRAIFSYDPLIATEFSPGEVGVSKIGAPEQFAMPLIFNNTGSFQFSVPVVDSSPIVSFLAMERLIVLTEKSTYVVRGGEQGILIPTSINPANISREGCSRTVKPRMKDRRGYFLNFDHTKLMTIEFGIDGNLVVYPISTLSSHLLAEDIHTMEVTGGKEDTVYLLRRDGKMIRITMNDAAPGFSLVETDGFIENIYVKRVKRDYYPYVPQSISSARQDPEYDALMAYVIRDGVRYTERLAYREDIIPEGFIYADQASIFGERLAKKPDGSYGRIVGTDILFSPQVADGCRINIVGSTYEAGEVLELYSTAAIAALDAPSDVARLHAFYEDEDGIVQFIRFVSQGVGVSADPTFTHVYEGYFESDVPTSLQDSEAANPSDKLAIQTRWLLASNLWDVVYTDGTELSIFADGEVVSSPLNPNKATLTAQSLTVAMPDYYCWGIVGRPYRSEMASMNIEAQDQRTLTDSHKIVNSVGVAFENSYGGFYGMVDQELEAMSENNWREDDNFNAPLTGFTGDYQITIPSQWTRGGRTAIIQVDPVPMTVLAMYPKGLASD
jgi:hypothetical protein